MKKIIICLILFLSFEVLLPAQQLPKITIVNNTGYNVDTLIIEPVNNNWKDWYITSFKVDSKKLLAAGQSIELSLPFLLNDISNYSIYLYDTDGDSYVKENIRITANMRIVFTEDDWGW